MNVPEIMLLVLGVVACFMGYSMFKSMLPLWGFLLGGWVVMIFAPMFIHINGMNDLILRIAAFVVGGIIGAVIAQPLYYVLIFLSGAAFGALGGIFLGAIFEVGGISSFRQIDSFTAMSFPPTPHTPIQFFFLIIGGLIMGVCALYFQKFMITASTAFIGAAALVGGLSGVISSGFKTEGIGLTLVVAWMAVGGIGMFIQYQVLGDEV